MLVAILCHFELCWYTISCKWIYRGLRSMTGRMQYSLLEIAEAKLILNKGSNKIWETHIFWRNIINNGAIWLQTLICNRLNPWFEMRAVWLSIQRNHPFVYERLLLLRLMHRGCHHSSDVPPLASWNLSCFGGYDGGMLDAIMFGQNDMK